MFADSIICDFGGFFAIRKNKFSGEIKLPQIFFPQKITPL